MGKVFVVQTKDVDGTTRRTYKRRENALERFEDMIGYKMEAAISEAFYDLPVEKQPTRETVHRVSGVSHFGTRVTFSELEP